MFKLHHSTWAPITDEAKDKITRQYMYKLDRASLLDILQSVHSGARPVWPVNVDLKIFKNAFS